MTSLFCFNHSSRVYYAISPLRLLTFLFTSRKFYYWNFCRLFALNLTFHVKKITKDLAVAEACRLLGWGPRYSPHQ